jgi:tRNA(fMet)-specific endonuclease VapC
MKFLLDTNTCIAYLTRRSSNVEEHLEQVVPADLALCSIVKSELLFGEHKSAKPAENLARLEVFFRPFASLPFDDRAAELAGQLRAELERAGTPIGPNDLSSGPSRSRAILPSSRGTRASSAGYQAFTSQQDLQEKIYAYMHW